MNPAPTLLNEWITSQAFWGFLFLAAFTGALYYGTEALKRGHAARVERDTPKQAPPAYDDTCCVDKCTRPGLVPFNTTNGVLFACRQCAGIVGQWVGADNQVYDQELDQATDLGQWEKEMPA